LTTKSHAYCIVVMNCILAGNVRKCFCMDLIASSMKGSNSIDNGNRKFTDHARVHPNDQY
jgi:hypothetical protein